MWARGIPSAGGSIRPLHCVGPWCWSECCFHACVWCTESWGWLCGDCVCWGGDEALLSTAQLSSAPSYPRRTKSSSLRGTLNWSLIRHSAPKK